MQNALPTFTFATSTTSTVAQFRVAIVVVTTIAEVFMINLVRKTREFAMLKIDGINFAHDRKWDQSKVENFGALVSTGGAFSGAFSSYSSKTKKP